MARYLRWNWGSQQIDENLSILDVIKFGTIDYKLASLFWLLMEQRASVMVAAGPAWVGKTTLLHALLDFLRPEIKQHELQGFYEDFKYLGDEKPENTYLVAEEISNHQYEYLWGVQVVKVFHLLDKGYALGSTTHARNIKEVAYILNALGVTPEKIAKLGAVVTMQVARGKYLDDEPVRFVDTVSTLNYTKDGLVAHILASRSSPEEKFSYPSDNFMQEVLSTKYTLKYDSISSEIETRGQFLRDIDGKKPSRKEFQKAIADYYRSQIS
jgi:hypothetical protein